MRFLIFAAIGAVAVGSAAAVGMAQDEGRRGKAEMLSLGAKSESNRRHLEQACGDYRQLSRIPAARGHLKGLDWLCKRPGEPQGYVRQFRCSTSVGTLNGRCGTNAWDAIWDGVPMCDHERNWCAFARGTFAYS